MIAAICYVAKKHTLNNNTKLQQFHCNISNWNETTKNLHNFHDLKFQISYSDKLGTLQQ